MAGNPTMIPGKYFPNIRVLPELHRYSNLMGLKECLLSTNTCSYYVGRNKYKNDRKKDEIYEDRKKERDTNTEKKAGRKKKMNNGKKKTAQVFRVRMFSLTSTTRKRGSDFQLKAPIEHQDRGLY
jgi:hypothetical protein